MNVTPDHLERHGTIENYASIKERLVAASDFAVVGVDDDICLTIAEQLAENGTALARISGSEGIGSDIGFDGDCLVDGSGQKIMSLTAIGSLRGRHNGQNAAAALSACRRLGLSDEDILKGFESFPRSCAPHGAGRSMCRAFCLSTIPKPPMQRLLRLRCRALKRSTGSPEGWPRMGELNPLHRTFRASKKLILLANLQEILLLSSVIRFLMKLLAHYNKLLTMQPRTQHGQRLTLQVFQEPNR